MDFSVNFLSLLKLFITVTTLRQDSPIEHLLHLFCETKAKDALFFPIIYFSTGRCHTFLCCCQVNIVITLNLFLVSGDVGIE